MALRNCTICDKPVEHELVNEYPDEIVAQANAKKMDVAMFAATYLKHVSFLVVRFDTHNGPCGMLCEGTVTPGLRGTPGAMHDGRTCPCRGSEP